jgi:PleD family two-component response regulator
VAKAYIILLTVDKTNTSIAEEPYSPIITPKAVLNISSNPRPVNASMEHRENANGKQFRVLVVDDSAPTLTVLSREIKEGGVTIVDQASDGFSALKLMKNTAYTVVIMDILMPIMVL